MSNLTQVVQRVKQERDQAQRRIEQLDEALKALTGLGGVRGTAGRRGPARASGKRRTMSAAAREGSLPRSVRVGPNGKRPGGRSNRDWTAFPTVHSQIFRFHAENCIDTDEATI